MQLKNQTLFLVGIMQDKRFDKFRVDDVAKMMYVIAKDIYIKQNMSDDVKRYVREKIQKGKFYLKETRE